MLRTETLKYLIDFMAGTNVPDGIVGYTSDHNDFANYKIVIIPCGFFDDDIFLTEKSMPKECQTIGGVPFLFGEPKTEIVGNTLVVKADLIASAYFLLSRYEELINCKRDEHNRFCGKDSVAGRFGFIDRPVVDEYGQLLRQWLRDAGIEINNPPEEFNNIYLTHDADKLTQYRNLRGMTGGLLRAIKNISARKLKSVADAIAKGPLSDPLFTFADMLNTDKKVKKAQSIVFIKAVKKATVSFDKPAYNLSSADAQTLINICKSSNCKIGLHTSYLSGEMPNIIHSEKDRLESAVGENIVLNRWHFLRSGKPDNMNKLAECGITDDFSIGFADIAGFRLGTCRAVRWIDPTTMTLTNLTLHPLTIMDCTLDDYMKLDETEAFDYCKKLIDNVKKHNGDLSLLWHNTSVSSLNNSYHKRLYTKLIDYISK